MILTDKGVLKLMQRIKSFITSQLNTKANSVHTHSISEIDDLSSLSMGGGDTKSEVDTLLNGKSDTGHTHTTSDITDFPTIPSKTSDLTNNSNFITSAVKESSIGDYSSGWCLLHGGLLIQWGTSVGTNDFTINFYKAFSLVPIVVANYGDNVDYGTPCTADDISKTAFIARHSSVGGAWRVNWIAIGMD